MSKGKKVACVLVFAIFCVVLWLTVYTVRSKQIDAYVESIEYANNISESTESDAEIVLVKVVVDEEIYTVSEFVALDEIPTVVDVIVSYDTGDVVTKPAYVTYEDVDDFVYEDDTYGRIMLPEE